MPIAPKIEQIMVLAEKVKQIWEVHCSMCSTMESAPNGPGDNRLLCCNNYDAAKIFYSHGWRYKLKDQVVVCPGCRTKEKGRR